MAARGNRLKNDSKKKDAGEKNSLASRIGFNKLATFLKNPQGHRITGLLLLVISAYLLIAFTSFLFTWKADQDKLSLPASVLLFSPEITVDNWLGKVGAMVAHALVHNGFGIASYALVFIVFLGGFRLLTGIRLVSFSWAVAWSLLTMTWLAVTLGYLFNGPLFFPGGAFGFHVTGVLNGLLGALGTGILLLFVFISVALTALKIPVFSGKKQDKETPEENEEPETTGNVMKAPVTAEPQDKAIELELGNESIAPEKLEPIHQPLIIENAAGVDDLPLAIDPPVDDLPAEEPEAMTVPEGEYDPKLELSSYQFPHLDLLENYGSNKVHVNKEELEENKNKIVETLSHYNISIEKIKATIGPTVTLYEIVPSAGIRISKIKNLEDDIALSLSALGIRIIAPIPGRGTIGIEVPNQKPEMVSMRSVLASEKFQNAEMELPVGLGKNISGDVFVTDLTKMPHLLMAGATGQGKSVGLNAILVSLLYKKHPSQVKFVLVDPKKVELTLYKKIERHFLAKLPGEESPIITDTKKVIHTLNSLCMEMDERYNLLTDAEVRTIKEYNAKFIARKLLPTKGHRFLPYIVLVVDEFADLIMTAGKEVEMPIARLAQLARAVGIHLIIATQRPSVNIITGTIKANFPARVAFRVTAKIDSRTILDTGGADQLIGRGDMLLSTGSDLIRLQCAFVDTPEVEKVADFIGSQRGYPDAFLLPEYHEENDGEKGGDMDPSERDNMFDEAARIVVQHQQGSASLLQRRLKLGYNRAGRIIDQLEAAGIIGPFEGSKAREVLIKDMYALEQFLNRQGNTP